MSFRVRQLAVVVAVVLFAQLSSSSPRADSPASSEPQSAPQSTIAGPVDAGQVIDWFARVSQPVHYAGQWIERQWRRVSELPPWGSRGGIRGALFELGVVDLFSVADWAGMLPAIDLPAYRIFATPPVTALKSSSYGWRHHPVLKRRRMHAGVDFRAGSGTRVRAAAPGRISYAAPMGTYGKLVKIDHGQGLETRYAHLRRIDVRAGDYVGAGTVVGLVGATGRVTGPHLHFEVRLNGRALDPESAFMVPLFNKPPKHRDVEYRVRKRSRRARASKRWRRAKTRKPRR